MRGKKFDIASLPIRVSVCDEPVDLQLLGQAIERLILPDPMYRSGRLGVTQSAANGDLTNCNMKPHKEVMDG